MGEVKEEVKNEEKDKEELVETKENEEVKGKSVTVVTTEEMPDLSIIHGDYYFKVLGYIHDFALSCDPDYKDKDGQPAKTINDLTDGAAYIGDDGIIYVYRKEPKKGDTIPWFTVKIINGTTPRLVYTTRISTEMRHAFSENNLINTAITTIMKDPDLSNPIYDEEMNDEIMKNRSTYTAVIKDNDDFLKKVIKKCLMDSGVNPRSFERYTDKPWTIPNIMQVLGNDTKLSTKHFLALMGFAGWEFKIIVRNGHNCQNPISGDVIYDSTLNDVYIEGKEKPNESSKITTACQFKDTDD